jgi:hypothetical protein
MSTATIATVLFLSFLLRACPPQSPPTAQPPQHQKPDQASTPALPREATGQAKAQPAPALAAIFTDDVATIFIFPSFADSLEELTARRRLYPLEVVYELKQDLSEGHIEVFNLLHVDAQYPLPDLSSGKHILDIPDKQYFYWPDNEQTLPDPMLFCSLGTSSAPIGIEDLWGNTVYSGKSVYDYKPPPPSEKIGDPGDLAAASRGDDLGFAEFNIPYKRNLELRNSGRLPEVEILGVGFVEGTPVECGKGVNPERFFTSPLRDVRVVSTVSHDSDNSIPVLKAARFTVPQGIFAYPRHIRIVGKVKP